ncbi:hypothetical protein CK203_093164 [Vitis vinifera]|uniref:Uncharacterized protein n=1 Tax=Vitis vinifera TaxID=29760 RepID=A0A438D6G9_VITVI|nr:hypothetical protein CK203_093164 [Vitis vinifera]
MKETETIVEMITRFTDIVNCLETLGKTYKESEKVMKILRSLPSKWHTKVTAIQEGKDLTKLPMEDLIGSLMTYDINLTKKLQESEDKKKKNIALKATTKEEEDVEEEKPSDEDDDLALITRKLNKYMREKRDLTCFKCKKPRHIKYDCLLYKSEAKRRMKKAMMATWSESEESSEEENEKEVENMYFMAIDDLDEGSKKDKWFLDSGCSRHMIGDESKFAFLTKRKGGYVAFGDNSKGRIIGQDNIGLETSMGKLQIEDRRQQEEVVEDPKKEESPLALPHPQQVQEFSKCKHSEFEMSMMGELNFFLGLQIKQLKEGTFINQAKYIRDLLKRFNMEEAKTMKTPMSSSIKLDMNEKGNSVNSTMYRGMIGTMDIGLWYPKGDNFELIGYSDADFADCKVERKNTSGTCHFLGHSLVSWHRLVQLHLRAPRASGERQTPSRLKESALLSHLSLSRRRLAERRVVTISELVFLTLVRVFYSRATYGLGGPVLSTVRGVEIRLSPESICLILDIPLVGLQVYKAKAWPIVPGFEPRVAVQRLCGLAYAQGMGKPSAHNLTMPSRVLHHMICSILLPRGGHRDEHDTSTPYGRFLTRVFKDVEVDLSRETNFEAPTSYDMYDEQSLGRIKFEKAPMTPGLRELSDRPGDRIKCILEQRRRPRSERWRMKPMMTEPSFTAGPSSQPSFTELPSQEPHAPDHVP